MFGKKRRMSVTAIGLACGVAAIVLGASSAASRVVPFSCAIEATNVNGTLTLESKVESKVAINGSYRFRVQTAAPSGATNLQQGGGFTVIPGNPVALGRIMLGDASAIYNATLEIAAGGTAVTCTKRIGGKI